MAKKSDTAVLEEPLAPAEPTPVVVAETPRRRLPGLALAGVIVGGVLIAGALFGGGVLVGVTLPGGPPAQGQFGPRSGEGPVSGDGFPGGGPGQNGERPTLPGQGERGDGS